MSSFLEHSYSIVHLDNAADQPSIQQLQQQLEKGTDESKVDTMRRILIIMLNGDPMPQLLMHIIRFVMPSKSKPLKKLLYFYYEICPKHDATGKLKQEMILVWSVLFFFACYGWGLWVSVLDVLTECTHKAMASGTISSMQTSTSAGQLSVSFAKFAKPNSSNPSCHRLANALSTATHTSAKTRFLLSNPYSPTRST